MVWSLFDTRASATDVGPPGAYYEGPNELPLESTERQWKFLLGSILVVMYIYEHVCCEYVTHFGRSLGKINMMCILASAQLIKYVYMDYQTMFFGLGNMSSVTIV